MILINGQDSDQLSVHDRGLHYGDGLFETIAVLEGQPLCWERHLGRLQRGCERLGITSPPAALLQEESLRLCGNAAKGVLKIIITRGAGGRGYQPPQLDQPTRLIGLYDWPDYPAAYQTDGIETTVCESRLGHNPLLAGIKHLNRLEQVIGRAELAKGNFPEGVVLDIADSVIEGTMSNIFCVNDDTLMTPELGLCGVAGIIREQILQLAGELGLKLTISPLTLNDIQHANEIFFCNSIMGIWPVIRLHQKQFAIGPWTEAIRAQLISARCIVPV